MQRDLLNAKNGVDGAAVGDITSFSAGLIGNFSLIAAH